MRFKMSGPFINRTINISLQGVCHGAQGDEQYNQPGSEQDNSQPGKVQTKRAENKDKIVNKAFVRVTVLCALHEVTQLARVERLSMILAALDR